MFWPLWARGRRTWSQTLPKPPLVPTPKLEDPRAHWSVGDIMRLRQHSLVLAFAAVCLAHASSAASPTPWAPATFPNPYSDVNRCGRAGVPSRICDPDSVLSTESANVVEGIIQSIEAPKLPFAPSHCSGASEGGYQVGPPRELPPGAASAPAFMGIFIKLAIATMRYRANDCELSLHAVLARRSVIIQSERIRPCSQSRHSSTRLTSYTLYLLPGVSARCACGCRWRWR